MEGTYALPSLNFPRNPVLQNTSDRQLPPSRDDPAPRSCSVSMPNTPDTVSIHLPNVPKYRRKNGYDHKTRAYGAPDIVRQIFTGKLTPTYFNDVCYGKRATSHEYRYNTPIRDRATELWEPKQVSRLKTRRASVRDIQDAGFRKQSQLEKASMEKEKERVRKTEAALMRGAEVITRGLGAFLEQNERQKQKYDAKIAARPKTKRKPKI